jgi:hypothetical protein
VPIGAYYLLKNGFGMGTLMALGLSSVVPAVRTGWGVWKTREVNGLAALILFVNVMSLLLGFVAGDPRLIMPAVIIGLPSNTETMIPIRIVLWLVGPASPLRAVSWPPTSPPPSKAEGNSSLAGSTHQYAGALRSPP